MSRTRITRTNRKGLGLITGPFLFGREKNIPLYENKNKEDKIMTIKFKNIDTGEIIEIDAFDRDAYVECLSHENYRIVFD